MVKKFVNKEEAPKQVEPPVPFRTSLLQAANNIINRDRAATHGKAEDSFATIAAYWSVYLTRELGISINVSQQDVAQLMVLFKIARIHNNSEHLDNWVDQAGYTALAAEMAMGGPNGEQIVGQ